MSITTALDEAVPQLARVIKSGHKIKLVPGEKKRFRVASWRHFSLGPQSQVPGPAVGQRGKSTSGTFLSLPGPPPGGPPQYIVRLGTEYLFQFFCNRNWSAPSTSIYMLCERLDNCLNSFHLFCAMWLPAYVMWRSAFGSHNRLSHGLPTHQLHLMPPPLKHSRFVKRSSTLFPSLPDRPTLALSQLTVVPVMHCSPRGRRPCSDRYFYHLVKRDLHQFPVELHYYNPS